MLAAIIVCLTDALANLAWLGLFNRRVITLTVGVMGLAALGLAGWGLWHLMFH